MSETEIMKMGAEPQVKDLMTSEVFTLFEDDSIKFLKELMNWKRIRHVPVVNQDHVVVGLVTHRDFLKAAISRLSQAEKQEDESVICREIPVEEVMRKNVTSVHPDTSLAKAAELMFTKKYGCLPVVEGGRLVGIVTEADFVRSFYEWSAYFTNEGVGSQ